MHPGSDGLCAQFYKFFWNDIKEILSNTFKYSFNEEMLSIDQRRAVLSLIPKPNKDLRYLKNWRPISLLNTDYKILAKTLATRLQSVINTIISPDQTGYIKGRYIGQNLRTIIDIIEYTNKENISGLMVFLDFQKAFDTISWPYLFTTLKAFNFGPKFRKWIEIFNLQ